MTKLIYPSILIITTYLTTFTYYLPVKNGLKNIFTEFHKSLTNKNEYLNTFDIKKSINDNTNLASHDILNNENYLFDIIAQLINLKFILSFTFLLICYYLFKQFYSLISITNLYDFIFEKNYYKKDKMQEILDNLLDIKSLMSLTKKSLDYNTKSVLYIEKIFKETMNENEKLLENTIKKQIQFNIQDLTEAVIKLKIQNKELLTICDLNINKNTERIRMLSEVLNKINLDIIKLLENYKNKNYNSFYESTTRNDNAIEFIASIDLEEHEINKFNIKHYDTVSNKVQISEIYSDLNQFIYQFSDTVSNNENFIKSKYNCQQTTLIEKQYKYDQYINENTEEYQRFHNISNYIYINQTEGIIRKYLDNLTKLNYSNIKTSNTDSKHINDLHYTLYKTMNLWEKGNILIQSYLHTKLDFAFEHLNIDDFYKENYLKDYKLIKKA